MEELWGLLEIVGVVMACGVAFGIVVVLLRFAICAVRKKR